jgi:hypothetical protein
VPSPLPRSVPTTLPVAHLQAAALTPDNILVREGTYRAIGECFPHLRSKVRLGQWQAVGLASGSGRRATDCCLRGSCWMLLVWRFLHSAATRQAAAPCSARTCAASLPPQVDFGAWYSSELRLILQSKELTGAPAGLP